jgi:ribosomal protein L22
VERFAPSHYPARGPGPMPPKRLREVTQKLEDQTLPASKLNLVARLIRKMPVEEARAQLRYSDKAISKNVLLTLDRAINKAKSMHKLTAPELIVGEAYVCGRIMGKKPDFMGRGRTGVITKRQSDLVIKLYEHPALVEGFVSTSFAHMTPAKPANLLPSASTTSSSGESRGGKM